MKAMHQYEMLWELPYSTDLAAEYGIHIKEDSKYEEYRPVKVRYLIPQGSLKMPFTDKPDVVQVTDSLGQVLAHEVIGDYDPMEGSGEKNG